MKIGKLIINNVGMAINFGELGIKELTGSINIGTTYEGECSEEIKAKIKEKLAGKIKDPSPFGKSCRTE
ncbi:hypothetical protein [Neobacillus mesonae]|uniref:hypothetical protein n=1 Tax=Neobacillus mesonae TaxID=1193713 RepID=UPI002572ADAC|nr:hypothetical protein [Neobacillus mesonae]MED4204069.1 hypothetical protein [Neobacillus mesonae]